MPYENRRVAVPAAVVARSMRRRTLRSAAAVAVAVAWAPWSSAAEASDAQPPVAAAQQAAGDAASPGGAPEEGVWVRRELNFTYMGFTSYYSCESLADKLRVLLRLAGARDDLVVRARGCAGGASQVDVMPSARLEFYTFAPAASAPPVAAPAAAPPAPPAKQLGRDAPKLRRRAEAGAQEPGVGAWRKVEIDGRGPRRLVAAGDCELVEQFTRDVLPLFTTRNVDDRTRCTPHQRSAFDVQLSFEAIGPVPSADVAAR